MCDQDSPSKPFFKSPSAPSNESPHWQSEIMHSQPSDGLAYDSGIQLFGDKLMKSSSFYVQNIVCCEGLLWRCLP